MYASAKYINIMSINYKLACAIWSSPDVRGLFLWRILNQS
jgi:hypothetical protein